MKQRKQYILPTSTRKEAQRPEQRPKLNRRKLTDLQSARRKRLLLRARRIKHRIKE